MLYCIIHEFFTHPQPLPRGELKSPLLGGDLGVGSDTIKRNYTLYF